MNGLVRLLFTVALILGFSLGFTLPASAHYVYSSGTIYANYEDSICATGRSEVSHGNGGGYYRVDENTHNCYRIAKDMPGGNISVRAHFLKWTGAEWAVCHDSGWVANNLTTNHWGISRNFGTSPPCGAGSYVTNGAVYIYWDNQWNGTWIWSGEHWLPA